MDEQKILIGGHPIEKKLCENLDDMKERVFSQNKGAAILIDGGVGEGKTTLGVHIANYINGKQINYEEQIAMGGVEFLRKLLLCKEKGHKVLIYDEAGDFSSKRILTKFNDDIRNAFYTYRSFKLVIIIILPSAKELDNTLLELNIIRLIIHVFKRGKLFGHYRAFSLPEFYKIKSYMKTEVIPHSVYFRTNTNFRGIFLNLSESESDKLANFSTDGKIVLMKQKILNNLKGKEKKEYKKYYLKEDD